MKPWWLTVALVVACSLHAQESDLWIDDAYADEVAVHNPFEAIDASLVEGLPKPRRAPHLKARRVYLPPTETPPPDHDGHYEELAIIAAGYVAPAPPDLNQAIRWERTAEGGHVGVLELYSANSKALRVQFEGDLARYGIELMVYDPKLDTAFGPYRLPILDEEGCWWSTIIFGESIGLEFYVPPDVPLKHVPSIKAIAYHYRGPDWNDFEPAGGCSHRDVACEEDFRDSAARAVTMLSVIMDDDVVGFCSGAALNRNPVDSSPRSPIVMTARHCVPNGEPAANTVLVWNFQNTTCNGTPPDPNELPRSTGTLLLKQFPETDWSLLGSIEPVAATFLLSWTNADWANGSTAIGIHHPLGTFKRIAFGTLSEAIEDRCFCPPGQSGCAVPPCFRADVWSIQYTTGGIELGSSGSPVMDENRRVRGTLSGGSCTIARYGRLREAFVNIRYYIFDMANPTFVNREAAGDPGNAGDTERGTSSNPFNTVYEATFCVPTNGTVRIAPGNYNERFTLWRPMTLQRSGSSGIVTIGAP